MESIISGLSEGGDTVLSHNGSDGASVARGCGDNVNNEPGGEERPGSSGGK